jgi:heterodisulfide reductase subunit A-like polyferredoxin
MKELVVISGKGGTGKTSIVASFAALVEKAVVADCDVDAADLHLVLEPRIVKRSPFSGGSRARIMPGHCAACGKCVAACPDKAIDLDLGPETIDVEVQAVIWATGWHPYDAGKIDRLGFGTYPNVITNVMMERLAAPDRPTAGKIQRPTDGKDIESVAFAQCAGSRDQNQRWKRRTASREIASSTKSISSCWRPEWCRWYRMSKWASTAV